MVKERDDEGRNDEGKGRNGKERNDKDKYIKMEKIGKLIGVWYPNKWLKKQGQ